MDEDYKCERDDGLTESEHIGIAIGISLAIIVLILIIMHCFVSERSNSSWAIPGWGGGEGRVLLDPCFGYRGAAPEV